MKKDPTNGRNTYVELTTIEYFITNPFIINYYKKLEKSYFISFFVAENTA